MGNEYDTGQNFISMPKQSFLEVPCFYQKGLKCFYCSGLLILKRLKDEVWDLDGIEYIDMSVIGIGTNILGYVIVKLTM